MPRASAGRRGAAAATAAAPRKFLRERGDMTRRFYHAGRSRGQITLSPFRLDAVGAVELDHFVVEAEDEKRGGPFADEVGLLLGSGDGQDQRGGHAAEGAPEENVGGDLGGLLFDAAGDEAFAL